MKKIFIKDNQQEAIIAIENKAIANGSEIAMIEDKMKHEAITNPVFAAELQSEFGLSSTSMFFAEQLLKSLENDKKKLATLFEDKRLAGVGNEDQYELEIKRVRRRMEKDENDFRNLFKK